MMKKRILRLTAFILLATALVFTAGRSSLAASATESSPGWLTIFHESHSEGIPRTVNPDHHLGINPLQRNFFHGNLLRVIVYKGGRLSSNSG